VAVDAQGEGRVGVAHLGLDTLDVPARPAHQAGGCVTEVVEAHAMELT
jgi:hypothetical protein